jgi:hypothetical protein
MAGQGKGTCPNIEAIVGRDSECKETERRAGMGDCPYISGWNSCRIHCQGR